MSRVIPEFERCNGCPFESEIDGVSSCTVLTPGGSSPIINLSFMECLKRNIFSLKQPIDVEGVPFRSRLI